MRVVMSLSGLQRNFSNFPRRLWLLLSDYRGLAKWFGAHYNQEVRFSSAVKCVKGPWVLTSLWGTEGRSGEHTNSHSRTHLNARFRYIMHCMGAFHVI